MEAKRESSMLTHEANLLDDMNAAVAATPDPRSAAAPPRKTPSTISSASSDEDQFMAQINEIISKTSATDAEREMELKERQAALDRQTEQAAVMNQLQQTLVAMAAAMQQMAEQVAKKKD
jgi:hypothetical protein